MYTLTENQMVAITDALHSLEGLGLVTQKHRAFLSVSRSAREVVDDPVPFWETICAHKLQGHEQQVLEITNRLSERSTPDYAWLEFPTREDAIVALGWQGQDSYSIQARYLDTARELSKPELGLVKSYQFANTDIGYGATYKGLVWQTRRSITTETKRIDALVAEWETTSIEFKRELHLSNANEKAEFIKDVLGLANTQASGKRYLIIGFDDKTRVYHGPPDNDIKSDRLEQILSHYTAPVVNIKYSVIPYLDRTIGQIEVLREPSQLPYKVAETVGIKKEIIAGQIFVRHGSQTVVAPDYEQQALEEEAARARKINGG